MLRLEGSNDNVDEKTETNNMFVSFTGLTSGQSYTAIVYAETFDSVKSATFASVTAVTSKSVYVS